MRGTSTTAVSPLWLTLSGDGAKCASLAWTCCGKDFHTTIDLEKRETDTVQESLVSSSPPRKKAANLRPDFDIRVSPYGQGGAGFAAAGVFKNAEVAVRFYGFLLPGILKTDGKESI